MSLTIHHLHLSQSERIVWLCEELSEVVPDFRYKLEMHHRDPATALAPPTIKEMHAAGTAPVMFDETFEKPIFLTESQAIVQYIIDLHGSHNFVPRYTDSNYAEYLQWYNFANGSLQATMTKIGTIMLLLKSSDLGVDYESLPMFSYLHQRMLDLFMLINQRLGVTKYLAGDELTAADIMIVFSLTTMRGFVPVDLGPHQNILRYLQDIANRPAYTKMLKKAEDGMEPMIQASVRPFNFLAFK